MATNYKQVSNGSSGSSVKQLQNLLNSKGYQLEEDGIFGAKTEAAVRDYQQKNGLQVDGIAGTQTWGSLTGAGTADISLSSTVAASVAPIAYVSGDTSKALSALEKGYQPSEEVNQAKAARQEAQAQRPGEYVSGFDAQLADLYRRINEREAFSYNPEEDAAYQSYVKQYQRQGRLAMEDTLGKAAGLTGGYGSSYAQSTAQQAYQSYLRQLQEVLPGLQENAWEQYEAQGEALLAQYDLLKDQDDTAYERWQNEVKNWQKAVSEAQDAYEYAASADLKKYQMLLDYYADKAQNELKLTGSGVVLASPAVSSIGNTESLSSVAGESLQRIIGNYLKNGMGEKAADLYVQYKDRMTPALKKSFTALFDRYHTAAE